MQAIGTGRNTRHLQVAVLIGDGEVRKLQHHDHGAHSGVNVTEDPYYTFAPEDDGARRAGWVKPNVKELAIVVREGIVENRIVVRKIDSSPDHNRKHVRGKRLVFLDHGHVSRLSQQYWQSRDGLKPNHDS